MRINLLPDCTALGLSLICTIAAVSAPVGSADSVVASSKAGDLKTCSGMVKSVDGQNRLLSVHSMFSSKEFSLGTDCTFAIPGRTYAGIGDLRPGQKVRVSYLDDNGVLVASRVDQELMRYDGTVKTIDSTAHTLVLHAGISDRHLTVDPDCHIILRNSQAGALPDIQIGQHISVVYETPAGDPVVREIAQTSANFAGTLRAIDASSRTLKARHVASTEEFHIGNNCVVVLADKSVGQLADLRLGDKVSLDYDLVDGVMIVNRIAEDKSPDDSTASQQVK